jgi:hypothetical protein
MTDDLYSCGVVWFTPIFQFVVPLFGIFSVHTILWSPPFITLRVVRRRVKYLTVNNIVDNVHAFSIV